MSRVSPDDKLLTADTVRDIHSLQMFARHIIDGLSIGRHASHHKGFSTEFKEHRSYVPGDQLRSLDWKLYGKTDRLYIKQFEEEINLQCLIAIDSSASMNYVGTRSAGLSKYNFGCALAACIGYLLLRQQDAVGLSRLTANISDFLPARSRPNYLQEISRVLLQPTSTMDHSLSKAIGNLASRIRGRQLIFIVSDLFDDASELLRILKLLRGARHDVVVFQIWDRDELDFPFTQSVEFNDLEVPSNRQVVQCQHIASAYRENVAKFRNEIRLRCREHSIDIFECVTDQSCGNILREFLQGRNAR